MKEICANAELQPHHCPESYASGQVRVRSDAKVSDISIALQRGFKDSLTVILFLVILVDLTVVILFSSTYQTLEFLI